MRYDRDIRVVREILQSVDINNTLNGGVSEPRVAISKQSSHYLLTARVPGVPVENLQVEIVDKKVIVHHPMPFNQTQGMVEVPQVIAAFPITPGIDYRNITAQKVDQTLEVILPFNELASGYTRHVDINL